MSVWTASVVDQNSTTVFLEYYKDGIKVFAKSYPKPANGDEGIQELAKEEIDNLILQDTPVTGGAITLPPPGLSPEQIARNGMEKLIVDRNALVLQKNGAVKLGDDVTAIQSQIDTLETEIKASLQTNPTIGDLLGELI